MSGKAVDQREVLVGRLKDIAAHKGLCPFEKGKLATTAFSSYVSFVGEEVIKSPEVAALMNAIQQEIAEHDHECSMEQSKPKPKRGREPVRFPPVVKLDSQGGSA